MNIRRDFINIRQADATQIWNKKGVGITNHTTESVKTYKPQIAIVC
ncbi:hypothetical protein [Flavobacterium sp.]|nr:hypothetical protein [Flavobacterium sp.]